MAVTVRLRAGVNPAPAGATGGCHCGAVRFKVRLAEGLRTARRCTCTYCRMKGAIAVTLAEESFDLIRGAEVLASYRFNTGTAEHHFCRICGIATHHARRSMPGQLAVSVACLDGLSPFDFVELPVMDGENHPSDTGTSRLAGVLRYDPGRP